MCWSTGKNVSFVPLNRKKYVICGGHSKIVTYFFTREGYKNYWCERNCWRGGVIGISYPHTTEYHKAAFPFEVNCKYQGHCPEQSELFSINRPSGLNSRKAAMIDKVSGVLEWKIFYQSRPTVRRDHNDTRQSIQMASECERITTQRQWLRVERDSLTLVLQYVLFPSVVWTWFYEYVIYSMWFVYIYCYKYTWVALCMDRHGNHCTPSQSRASDMKHVLV